MHRKEQRVFGLGNRLSCSCWEEASGANFGRGGLHESIPWDVIAPWEALFYPVCPRQANKYIFVYASLYPIFSPMDGCANLHETKISRLDSSFCACKMHVRIQIILRKAVT